MSFASLPAENVQKSPAQPPQVPSPHPNRLGLILGLGAAALFVLLVRIRLSDLDLPYGAVPWLGLAIASGGLLLMDVDDWVASTSPGTNHLVCQGFVTSILGMGCLVGFGLAGLPWLAMLGLIPLFWGFGNVLNPVGDDDDHLIVAPALGCAGALLVVALVGTTIGITESSLSILPAVLAAVALLHLTRAKSRRASKEPSTDWLGWRRPARIGSVVALAAVLGVGVWVTALPYGVLKPALPFGRDMQHLTNARSIAETGRPEARSKAVAEFYPDTFGYWAGAVSQITDTSITKLFRALPTAFWLLGALQLFLIGRALFGTRAGLLGLVAYAVWSYQPRQVLVDGAHIGLLAEYVFVPAVMFAVLRCCQRPTLRRALVVGFLAGATIQTHFLSTSRLLAVVTVFFAGALLVSRHRFQLLQMIALSGAAAFMVGLPYSIRYLGIYVRLLHDKVVGEGDARYSAAFPPIRPGDFGSLLGKGYVLLAVFSVVAFILNEVLSRPMDLVKLWTTFWASSWFMVTLFLISTGLLLTAERDLRSLAFPLALFTGWGLDFLVRNRAPVLRAAAALSLIGCAFLWALPDLIRQSTYVSSTEIYVTAPEYDFLQSLQLERLAGAVGTDESGVWLPYFVRKEPLVAMGGPAGFRWFGEPLRSRMQQLYDVLQKPCDPTAGAKLHALGLNYVYLGPRPSHWTPPGYQFVHGSRLRDCPSFELMRHDASTDAWFFAVRQPSPSPVST